VDQQLCPQCGCSVMQTRLQEFHDGGEDLEISECGVCGYTEWLFETEIWSFGGDDYPTPALSSPG
jgi:ribosomal protein S27AE